MSAYVPFWQLSIDLLCNFTLLTADWQPCQVKEYFHFYISKCDMLHRLTCRDKATRVSSEPARWSCDVCQRMPDFDSCQFIFIWMAYITYWVMPICARFNVTFDIGVHVGGSTGGQANATSKPNFIASTGFQFHYQWGSTARAPLKEVSSLPVGYKLLKLVQI